MTQPANSGSLEQILRCLKLLAQSQAFTTEMATVASYMGPGAFKLGNFHDAAGLAFTLNLNDGQFGDPASWLPSRFRAVYVSAQPRPVPPYPLLQLLGYPGRMQSAAGGPFETDTGEVAGWSYIVDAVTIATADKPELAARRAMALAQGLERLIRRNQILGGLVQLIAADGPPAPGGEQETRREGLISGVLQRYRVEVKTGIV